MVLLHKNSDLSGQVDTLQIQVASLQVNLNKTQNLLSESYVKNAELENDAVFLRKRITRIQAHLAEERKRIIALGQHLYETVRTNEHLYSRNEEMSQHNLRLSFENQEMRKTLSSVSELKKAISALRKKTKRSPAVRPVVPVRKTKSIALRPKAPVRSPEPVEPVPEILPDATLNGNLGFIVKDGHSTFEDLVNIKVIPAETAGVSQGGS